MQRTVWCKVTGDKEKNPRLFSEESPHTVEPQLRIDLRNLKPHLCPFCRLFLLFLISKQSWPFSVTHISSFNSNLFLCGTSRLPYCHLHFLSQELTRFDISVLRSLDYQHHIHILARLLSPWVLIVWSAAYLSSICSHTFSPTTLVYFSIATTSSTRGVYEILTFSWRVSVSPSGLDQNRSQPLVT